MAESRTKKTIRNTFFSFLYKFLDVALAFVLRTIFINTLGVSYLGLSGLFTNILNVLSLMELGVGSAIVFSLYEPLAKGDTIKIVSLMNLYKKTYNAIGILVSVIGFLLTPLLKYIIVLPENVGNLNWIYWLSIANTSVSYFLAYKRTLLIADQRSDLNTRNLILFRFIRFGVLTIILRITNNFLIYLLGDVLITLASNIQITYVIRKRYPYLDNVVAEPLQKTEKMDIVKYMTSGIFTKIGQTVVTSTDSIVISAFINTVMVGVYSNYSMVTAGFDAMIYLVFSSITASVGNFAVLKEKEEAEILFKKINMANYVLVFIVSVCMYALITPFVILWVGEEYRLPDITVCILILNFYIIANQNSIANFMGASGKLYYINRYRSLIEAIVNLVVSISLVKFTSLGISGVFMGTTVCFLCGRVWMDAYTLYKYWFEKSFIHYLKTYIFRLILFVFTAVMCQYITQYIIARISLNVFSWLLCGAICLIISMTVVFVVFGRTDEFRYYMNMIKNMIGRFKQKDK